MVAYIGLLRAVNVSGSSTVRMEALRATLTGMGLGEVRTLLQSGNFVFRTDRGDAAGIENRIEERLAKELSLSTDVFVRSAQEWNSVARENPFPQEASEDPGHLVVTVLKQAPTAEAWRALDAAIRGRERVRGVGRHAYIVYTDGIGRSRLTPVLIEKQLGTRGTSRNWNTVRKLAEAAAALG